jgi:hypothetical protein
MIAKIRATYPSSRVLGPPWRMIQFSDDASVGKTEDEESASPGDRDAPTQPPGKTEVRKK